MSLYILDTDVLTLYRRGHALLVPRVDSRTATETAIPVVTVEEQLSGWYTLIRQAKVPKDTAHAYLRLASTVRFLGRWQILSLTEPAIACFESLKALKLNVGGSDLRIAAIAPEHGGILVSRNLRDFQRVPGLIVEDWSA
jgi:tRNA(fMet)-specific endonuclease VapC